MKIAYIAPTDPFKDKKAWSGTYFNIREALEKAGHQVTWIGYSIKTLQCRITAKFLKNIVFDVNLTEIMGKAKVNSIKENFSNYDLIFVPAQSDIISALKTSTPIIHYSDATVHAMINYYWFGLSNREKIIAERTEQKAISNTTLNIYSSHWAANSAINDYGADPNRIAVLPFGANVDDSKVVPIKPYEEGKNSQLNILFSGINWERKGGQIAVDTVNELNKSGIDTQLIICGIRNLDSKIENLPFVKNIGFLNKNIPEQYNDYLSILENSDIFILPTRAECSATVLNEANAYGIPILTTDTGGLSDYVINNVNGQRLALSDGGKEYADVIKNWIKENRLKELSKGARKLYNERNSWNAWSNNFNRLLSEKIL